MVQSCAHDHRMTLAPSILASFAPKIALSPYVIQIINQYFILCCQSGTFYCRHWTTHSYRSLRSLCSVPCRHLNTFNSFIHFEMYSFLVRLQRRATARKLSLENGALQAGTGTHKHTKKTPDTTKWNLKQ